MGVWSQEGRRVISFCLPAGPTKAVRISGASFSRGGDIKSESEGPVLRRSLKIVGERRVVDVGGAVGSVGSETAVAKVRVEETGGCIEFLGAEYKQRNRVTLEAISEGLLFEERKLKSDKFIRRMLKDRYLRSNPKIDASRIRSA